MGMLNFSKSIFRFASKVREIVRVEELSDLIKSGKPVLVDFTASWCGPCRMLAPVLESAAAKNGSIDFVKVDIDRIPELAEKHRVSSVPFVSLFKDGKELDKFIGARDATFLQNFLENALKE